MIIKPVNSNVILAIYTINLFNGLIPFKSIAKIIDSSFITNPSSNAATIQTQTHHDAQLYVTDDNTSNILGNSLSFEGSRQFEDKSSHHKNNLAIRRRIDETFSQRHLRNARRSILETPVSIFPKTADHIVPKVENPFSLRSTHHTARQHTTPSVSQNGNITSFEPSHYTLQHFGNQSSSQNLTNSTTPSRNQTTSPQSGSQLFGNQTALQSDDRIDGNRTLQSGTLSNQTFEQPIRQSQLALTEDDQTGVQNVTEVNNQTMGDVINIKSLGRLKSSQVPLDTKITAPFSILGVILILSGLPMCFWGGRNRWSSYFLTGAYAAAVLVMVPILRFGVIEQNTRPNNVLQGIFVVVCCISSIAAGAVAVIFWKGTRFLVGGLGGFIISLFILSLKSDSLIQAAGLRWIFILATTSVGFVLATIPAITILVTLFATATVGAAAVVLGIDCFTTGGLKEFWLYILGFGALFPNLNYFPFTVTMQAELGVMGALFLMGAAVQWRLLEVIWKKINELKQLDLDRQLKEEAAAYRQSMVLEADLAFWEKRHGDNETRTSGRRSPKIQDNRSSRPSKASRHASHLSYELIDPLPDPFAVPKAEPDLKSSRRGSLEPLTLQSPGTCLGI